MNTNKTILSQAIKALDSALDRAVDAMNAAADFEVATGSEAADDSALMAEVYAADDAITECEAELVKTAARIAIEMAADYAPMEKAIVADMFAPALENRYTDYSPMMREKLVAKAYALAAAI